MQMLTPATVSGSAQDTRRCSVRETSEGATPGGAFTTVTPVSEHVILLAPSSNRVYAGGADTLAAAELAVLLGEPEADERQLVTDPPAAGTHADGDHRAHDDGDRRHHQGQDAAAARPERGVRPCGGRGRVGGGVAHRRQAVMSVTRMARAPRS